MFYSLYLDESKFFDPNKQDYIYCIAGIIINNKQLPTIRERIDHLKMKLWTTSSNYLANQAESFIFHEAEIRSDNTNIISKRPEYIIFHQNRSNKRKVIEEIGNIIQDEKLTILGAIENQTQVENNYQITRDSYSSYYLCLKSIVENYCAFLRQNHSHGNIILESRKNQNSTIQDQRTRKIFNKILVNGTLIYSALELQQTIYYIKFIQKQENDVGLQIADFIPRPLLLNYSSIPQSKPSIYQKIRKARYNGPDIVNVYPSKFGVCIFD